MSSTSTSTATSSSAPSTSSIQDTLVRGITLQQQGQNQDAAALFRDVLRQDPGNAAAMYSLAVVALHAADPLTALQLGQQGVAAAPHFAPLHNVLGSALQRLGRNAEAVPCFDQALALGGEQVDVLLNSGVALRHLFRHKEALERFARVLAVDPLHAAALANCGILLTEFKQSAQAIGLGLELGEVQVFGIDAVRHSRRADSVLADGCIALVCMCRCFFSRFV